MGKREGVGNGDGDGDGGRGTGNKESMGMGLGEKEGRKEQGKRKKCAFSCLDEASGMHSLAFLGNRIQRAYVDSFMIRQRMTSQLMDYYRRVWKLLVLVVKGDAHQAKRRSSKFY